MSCINYKLLFIILPFNIYIVIAYIEKYQYNSISHIITVPNIILRHQVMVLVYLFYF